MIIARLRKRYNTNISKEDWMLVHNELCKRNKGAIYSTILTPRGRWRNCVQVNGSSRGIITDIPKEWTGKVSNLFRSCNRCGAGEYDEAWDFDMENSVECDFCGNITDKWIPINPIWRVEI